MTDDTATEAIPDTPEPATGARPRIRLGAVIWGLIVIATAAAILWVEGSAERRAAFATWLGGLTPASVTIIAVLALGAFVLVVSLTAVVRRSQRQHPPIG